MKAFSPLEGEMPEGQRGSVKAARRLSGANPSPTPSGLPPISPSRGENTPPPTRRAFLAAATASLLPLPASAAPSRIAAIDWAMLETVLALGVVPVAATELIQFRRIAVEPPVPPETADLGLRGTPNYELLRIAAPDLILISNFYEYQRPSLERMAPVFSLPLYLPGQPPFAQAERAALELGAMLGREAEGARLVARARAELEALRSELQSYATRPVFVVSIGDAQHFRAFGTDSMFGDVLARLGLSNAWNRETSYGAAAPIGIAALADVPDARIVIVPPVPPEARRALPESALWNALPPVAANRVATIEPVNHFGALPAALRFARLLGRALLSGSASDA